MKGGLFKIRRTAIVRETAVFTLSDCSDVPDACVQLYHPSGGSHGQMFRPNKGEICMYFIYVCRISCDFRPQSKLSEECSDSVGRINTMSLWEP